MAVIIAGEKLGGAAAEFADSAEVGPRLRLVDLVLQLVLVLNGVAAVGDGLETRAADRLLGGLAKTVDAVVDLADGGLDHIQRRALVV